MSFTTNSSSIIFKKWEIKIPVWNPLLCFVGNFHSTDNTTNRSSPRRCRIPNVSRLQLPELWSVHTLDLWAYNVRRYLCGSMGYAGDRFPSWRSIQGTGPRSRNYWWWINFFYLNGRNIGNLIIFIHSIYPAFVDITCISSLLYSIRLLYGLLWVLKTQPWIQSTLLKRVGKMTLFYV